jgi:hypothetical protein
MTAAAQFAQASKLYNNVLILLGAARRLLFKVLIMIGKNHIRRRAVNIVGSARANTRQPCSTPLTAYSSSSNS